MDAPVRGRVITQSMKHNECGGPVTTEHNALRRYTLGRLPHAMLRDVEVRRCGNGKIAIACMA
jgi:hypothetical protein